MSEQSNVTQDQPGSAKTTRMSLFDWSIGDGFQIFSGQENSPNGLVVRKKENASTFSSLEAVREAIKAHIQSEARAKPTNTAVNFAAAYKRVEAKVVLRKSVTWADVMEARRARSVYLGRRVGNNYVTELAVVGSGALPSKEVALATIATKILLGENGVTINFGDGEDRLFPKDHVMTSLAIKLADELRQRGIDPANISPVAGTDFAAIDEDGMLDLKSGSRISVEGDAPSSAPAAEEQEEHSGVADEHDAGGAPAHNPEDVNASLASVEAGGEETGISTEEFFSSGEPAATSSQPKPAVTSKPATAPKQPVVTKPSTKKPAGKKPAAAPSPSSAQAEPEPQNPTNQAPQPQAGDAKPKDGKTIQGRNPVRLAVGDFPFLRLGKTLYRVSDATYHAIKQFAAEFEGKEIQAGVYSKTGKFADIKVIKIGDNWCDVRASLNHAADLLNVPQAAPKIDPGLAQKRLNEAAIIETGVPPEVTTPPPAVAPTASGDPIPVAAPNSAPNVAANDEKTPQPADNGQPMIVNENQPIGTPITDADRDSGKVHLSDGRSLLIPKSMKHLRPRPPKESAGPDIS